MRGFLHSGILSATLGMGSVSGALAGTLELIPSGPAAFQGYVRGPFQPHSAALQLTNVGTEAVFWAAGASQNWCSTYERSGLLFAGQSAMFEVFPNALALELDAGAYEAEVWVTNHLSTEVFMVEVSLTITMPPPGRVEELPVAVTNQLRLTWSGASGTTYAVLETLDLKRWEVIATNQFVTKQASLALNVLERPHRFFRAEAYGPEAVAAHLRLAWDVTRSGGLLQLEGAGGGTYLVEGTTNLTDWVPVFTNKLPAAGSTTFLHEAGASGVDWTYRALELGLISVPTLHHILIIGQSLAIGAESGPVLSETPSPDHFWYYNDGVLESLGPLYETGYETMASGAGGHLSSHAPSHRIVVSNTGLGGAGYELLKKGTEPYRQGIVRFREAPFAAACLLLGHVPSAIFAVHGEGDHIDPFYGQRIRQWQEDYEHDAGTVTGHRGGLPMFHSQASAWTSPGNGSARYTLGAFLVLEESELNPDKTILVCPKYFLNYSDGIHLTNTSYRWLGEYYAKAYQAVVVESGQWTPLKPINVTRSNTVIRAQFHVPVPPMVLDTVRVTDPGQYGFSFDDGSGSPPEILDVTLDGGDAVLFTLASMPTPGNERLRYAYTAEPGSPGGPQTGPRGNLRDSDATPSPYGNDLFNWCVHFDKPVTDVTPEP